MAEMNQSMAGKVCLVTGATLGIGLVTARALAERGATVVAVGRNPERGQAALAEIKRRSGNDQVYLLLADLGSQAAIRQLAADFQQRFDRLHVLVNNAGALNMSRSLTVDGIETTWAVNHLAYFLLTNLLLDRLKASAPARIINIASDAQRSGQINFADLQGEKSYSGGRAYSQSKLANVLFTYELARRLEGTGITANCVHPGVVATGFAKNNGLLFRLGASILGLFTLSPEKGAETQIYLATSPEVEGVTGQYFVKQQAVRSAPASYDETVARRLWEVSEQMTGLAVGKA